MEKRNQDKILTKDWVEIISSSEADRIKEEAKQFFLPVTESIKDLVNERGIRESPENITAALRRALSYIIIANKKKAWIYGDEIIEDSLEQIGVIIKYQEYISNEGLNRVKTFRNLLQSYNCEEIDQLSVSDNPSIAHDFFDFMDDSLVNDLSESNFNFGLIEKDLGKLKRDIKEYVTTILQSSKLPYITGGMGLLTSFVDYRALGPTIATVLGLISHHLRNVDLREYAPPMKREDLFSLVSKGGSFSYSEFNHEYKVLI